jgi:hypothetical protein
MCQHSHYTGVRNPGIVTNWRKFGTQYALHSLNVESTGNYHLMNKESTLGREFLQELPAYLLGFRLVREKIREKSFEW